MPTNNELQHICDRLIQGAGEFRQYVVTLAGLQRDIQAKQAELASLDSRIAEAKRLAGQVDEIEQAFRTRQRELAELELVIRQKHEAHGQIDGDLRTLMRKAAKLTEPAA